MVWQPSCLLPFENRTKMSGFRMVHQPRSFYTIYMLFSLYKTTQYNGTIQKSDAIRKPDQGRPFEYRTRPVFGSPLYYTLPFEIIELVPSKLTYCQLNWFARKNVDDTIIYMQYLLMSLFRFVQLLKSLFHFNLEVCFTSEPSCPTLNISIELYLQRRLVSVT